MTLLGTIVDHEGAICLQTSPRVWYPLEGSSGIASDFREQFNHASHADIGKQLHRVGGVLQMENCEQRCTRQGHTWETTGAGAPDAVEYRCSDCGALDYRDRS